MGKRYIVIIGAVLLNLAACSSFKSDHDKGLEEMDKGNLTNAINLFTKSIEANKDLVSSYNHRGLSYLYMGDFSLSIDDFTSAIELEEDAVIFHNRALAYLELGLTENAFADLNMAGKLNETDLELLLSTGYGMLDLGYHIEAERVFTKALIIDTECMEAFNGRGNVRMELGDNEGAERDWNRAIEISRKTRNNQEI